jgi:hypothetical protein
MAMGFRSQEWRIVMIKATSRLEGPSVTINVSWGGLAIYLDHFALMDIDALNRLFGQERGGEAMPSLDAVLVKRDCDVFIVTMLDSITTLHPKFVNEWRGWSGTLPALARTQSDPQFRQLELQALSLTLLANDGEFIDQDAKALAKQSPEVRAAITKQCSADPDAFVDMVVPCSEWGFYSGLERTAIDSYSRSTKFDAPVGFYRLDTPKVDVTGLTLKGQKWIGKDGKEVEIDKITAHVISDVPIHDSKHN